MIGRALMCLLEILLGYEFSETNAEVKESRGGGLQGLHAQLELGVCLDQERWLSRYWQ
jgi:hypothetical protein